MAKQHPSEVIVNKQYNIGHICTKQQCDAGLATKVALRWVGAEREKIDFSFAAMDAGSNQVANVLGTLGAKSRAVLATLLPKCPEHFTLFLGTLKRQLVCAPLFSNLGDEAIFERLHDSQAWALVTKKSLLQKVLRHKERHGGQLAALKWILVVDIEEDISPSILSLKRLLRCAATTYETPITRADTPSVLHYTSGSTGKPKGVLHVHGGITAQYATVQEVLQLTSEDVYWCTADHGWVTGTSYGITAPWSAGVTQLHYGGLFDATRWLEILAQEQVTVWYTAPTALRMLMRTLEQNLSAQRLAALRSVFSVGEPLNPAVIEWVRQFLHTQIYDTWFQTETGAIMIANRPGVPVKPGSMGTVVPGIEACVVDIHAGDEGVLALKAGWSSMFVTYLNNEDAYTDKFRDGYYLSGDCVACDSQGYFWFSGRTDDVINTGGHLVSPFEIESVLLELDEVAEAAAVGIADEILFEKVVVFVSLHRGVPPDKNTEIKIRLHISRQVSSVATPQQVIFLDDIPKNSSGKIMRRILRSRLNGTAEQDTSTMENA